MPIERRESPPENKLHEIAGLYSSRMATVENGQNKHCNNVLAFLQRDTQQYRGGRYRLAKKTIISFTDFTMSSSSINANASSKYFFMLITDLIFSGIY